jgi:hypothetical protein
MESTSTEAPDTSKRVWLRRLTMGAACVPLAVVGILHKMGRSDDFGVLGKWYVMIPLTIAGVFAWLLVEKAAERTSR